MRRSGSTGKVRVLGGEGDGLESEGKEVGIRERGGGLGVRMRECVIGG